MKNRIGTPVVLYQDDKGIPTLSNMLYPDPPTKSWIDIITILKD